ncbi:MAG: LysM peptidoglycan-binding domain-containing protein, partial [Gammaproteobacteria bacterium]|nr:LysM peptidoglycan-binding domain-containing protein [Gammaproteobacteria bacterium]
FFKIFLSFFLGVLPLLWGPAQASDGDLWQRVQSQLSLYRLEHRRIDAERSWYERNPEYMRRVSERAAPYLHHVVEEVERRGMPMELALLPIMESAYDPFAYSHGRAAGIWQIIPGTGRDLGLTQDWWYDGRRDVRASTDAALNYLGDLSEAFDGDWLKALAAYNGGKRRLQNAIAANRSSGRATDFWSLKLPVETRNYVPRLLALSQVIADPDAHGIVLTPAPDQAYFGVVDTGSQIDLAQAASLANIDIESLYMLNPGFNRWATSPEGPHQLLLPVARLADFNAGLADLDPTQRVKWVRYTIRNGDAMSLIARKFNTEAGVIREVNGLRSNKIRAGATLMIPTASAPLELYALSVEQRTANKQERGTGNRLDYRVKPGDSFWLIARRHGVSTRKLAEWNGLAVRDSIHPGQNLVIWTPLPVSVTAPPVSSRDPVVRKLGYRVRNGDSLARIAGKFNISVADIVGWNHKLQGKKYIHPGQVLTLYVDITGS